MPQHSYGIDYGMGMTNVDHATGIRFGCLPANDIDPYTRENFELVYGKPTCPKCGNEVQEPDYAAPGKHWSSPNGCHEDCPVCALNEEASGHEYYCFDCNVGYDDGSDVYGDEPVGEYLDEDGYLATIDSHGDIVIMRSPYYTHAEFCSPCLPGGVYIKNAVDKQGPKGYCLGHEFFEGDKAPYPIWRVDNNEFVKPGAAE